MPDPSSGEVVTLTPPASSTVIPQITVQYYVPLMMENFDGLVAESAMDVLSELSGYLWSKQGYVMMEQVSLDGALQETMRNAAVTHVEQGPLLESVQKVYGEGCSVTCDGWYDEKGNFYSLSGERNPAEFGLSSGEVVAVYAAYTIHTDNGTYACAPCILDASLRLGILRPKLTYMMGLPVGEQVELPYAEGYTMQWTKNGEMLPGETLTVAGGMINRYGLEVAMN